VDSRPGGAAQDEADAGAPVCPLSKDQTKKRSMLSKPWRLFFAWTAASTATAMWIRSRKATAVTRVDRFPDSHDDGSVDFDRTFAQCSAPGCHEELPGGGSARAISFVNKTDTQLCKQMRSQFARAQGQDSFMGHMKFDNNDTQFIKAAFKGNKAIKTAIVEKPTPWTQDKMVELSQAWVDAMGGRFHGDESCGCEQQNYALHLDYT